MSIASDRYTILASLQARTPLEELEFEKLKAIVSEEFEAMYNPEGMATKIQKLTISVMDAKLASAQAEADVSKQFAKPLAMMKMVGVLDSYS